jgi:flagellar hook-basal body complex protein FliE
MSGMRVDFPIEMGAKNTLNIGGEPGIRPEEGVSGTSGSSAAAPEGISFSDLLEKTVGEANKMDAAASAKAQSLAEGRIDDLHGTMIAMKEADISMKLVGTVRNKLLDAFHELWRTSV